MESRGFLDSLYKYKIYKGAKYQESFIYAQKNRYQTRDKTVFSCRIRIDPFGGDKRIGIGTAGAS